MLKYCLFYFILFLFHISPHQQIWMWINPQIMVSSPWSPQTAFFNIVMSQNYMVLLMQVWWHSGTSGKFVGDLKQSLSAKSQVWPLHMTRCKLSKPLYTGSLAEEWSVTHFAHVQEFCNFEVHNMGLSPDKTQWNQIFALRLTTSQIGHI